MADNAPRAVFALEPGHVGRPSLDGLTTTEQRDIVAQRIDDKLREQSRAITEAVAAAADIEDDEIATDESGKVIARKAPTNPGLPARAFRIARDARRANKDAPVYLKMMADIHRGYVAADAAKGADPTPLNVTYATQVNVTVHQYGAVDYPVREIREDDNE